MTLVIGVRCKDGCLTISDRRSHIKKGERTFFQDDFRKVVKRDDFLIFNHGYNRIHDADWKLHAESLTADAKNEIYLDIAREMKAKPDKQAFFVFLNAKQLLEITISAERGVSLKDYQANDRIVSGSGMKYVSLDRLKDLPRKPMAEVRGLLETTFQEALQKLKEQQGDEFSAEYDLTSFPIPILQTPIAP